MVEDKIKQGVSSISNRVNGVGAVALAALHSLDYSPENKLDFAVGFGNYKGTSAVAIGAYYRPNENAMISFGGTMDGEDHIFNADISWKLGKTTPKENRQTQLQQEVDTLKEKNGVMEKTIQEQNEKIKELEVLVRSFIHK